jgi:pimeloyl-ACP methyl ester carboxylesterase
MRKAGRVLVVFVLSLLSTAVLGAMAAIVAAVSLAATALIAPGTGTPNANVVTNYREHFVDRYSEPFDPSCTSTNGCDLTGIDYPASFFPLFFFSGWCVPGRCETWNQSVGLGATGMYDAVEDLTDPDGAILLGYSQGGAVVSNALRQLAADPALLDKVAGVVLIGNAYNPDGGLFTRFGFLPTIPFLDITFGPATPVHLAEDIGEMTFIGFEYDPVMYAPRYWGNPFAVLNALAAFDNVHGYYLTPTGSSSSGIAYGYTPAEVEAILAGPCPGANCRIDEYGNEYWMIPAKGLPIVNLVTGLVPGPLQPLVQPVAELVTPVLKVLVDLGYDWNGDPAQTRYMSILPFNPFQNWVQVGADLAAAVVEGIENAFGSIQSMVAPLGAGVAPLTSGIATVTSVDESEGGEDASQEDGQEGGPESNGVDEDSTIEATAASTPAVTDPTTEPVSEPTDATVNPVADFVDAAQAKLDEAKAEREAAREQAAAERAAAKAEREAKREAAKAEREAKREAAKAEREAKLEALKDKWASAQGERAGNGDDAGTDVDADATDADNNDADDNDNDAGQSAA